LRRQRNFPQVRLKMSEKGVSPLIAMVVMVAIVMSLAVVISGFLTDFVGEREHGAREDAGRTIDCTLINLDLKLNSIDYNGELNFFLTSRNDFPLRGMRVVTYNLEEGTVETDREPEPENLEALETVEMTVDNIVDSPDRIEIRNMHCPNFELAVQKDWRDEWVESFD